MEILDLLHPRDILVREPAHAKRPLLDALARQLASRTGLSFGSVLTALLDREKLGATCIGQGIGIPHAMLERLREPAAVLAVLQQPIPYAHRRTSTRVDVVLGVVWPREVATDFLNALARFCRHLSQPQVLKKVRAAMSAEEVLQHLGEPKNPGYRLDPRARRRVMPGPLAMHGQQEPGDERDGDGQALAAGSTGRMSDQELADALGCDIAFVHGVLECWGRNSLSKVPAERTQGVQTCTRLAIAHALHTTGALTLAGRCRRGGWKLAGFGIPDEAPGVPSAWLSSPATVNGEADPLMQFVPHAAEAIPIAAADEYLDVADGRRVYWRKPRRDAYLLACDLHRLSRASRREDTPALAGRVP